MYKLVVVAGELRGKEYPLENGENTVGRSDECQVHLPVKGISKSHFAITISDDSAYVKDLGSSNGTFVNGKIIKQKSVKNGDKIVLPDTILQVVYVKEKKVIVKKKAQKIDVDDDSDPFEGGTPPQDLVGKIKHFAKYRFMKMFHGINEEFEWSFMIGVFFVLFIVAVVSLTILPALQDSKRILVNEIALRGGHYAEEISRINAKALEQKKLQNVDTNFLSGEPGVVSYELFDLDGRIVRPIEKLNEYSSDPFSAEVKDWANQNSGNDSEVKYVKLPGNQIGIAKRIMAFNPRTSRNEAVAAIAIRFRPSSLEVEKSKSQKAFAEAIVTSVLVGVVFFAMVYYLTVRPVEELQYQIEEALRGKRKHIEASYLMNEMDSLRKAVNSILQRNRELEGTEDDSEFAEAEDDGLYVQRLEEFLTATQIPCMILDSQKQIKRVTAECADITRISEDHFLDVHIEDAGNKNVTGSIVELCDNTAIAEGACAEDVLNFSGDNYRVAATCLIGKDNTAKAYFITFTAEG